MKAPIKVTITGAAGHIGYALAFRVASGEMFGPEQPVILRLLEIPQALSSLHGVGMELEDCALPLLYDIVLTDDPAIAFRETDYAILIGAKPRGKGMERKDLITENAKIFSAQARPLMVLSTITIFYRLCAICWILKLLTGAKERTSGRSLREKRTG